MTPQTPPGTIASIALTDAHGEPTTLGVFRADPLVVILVRYFGCLPCQDFVREVDRMIDRFPDGSRVIAVGGSADYQARWLQETKGVELPLLLDPEQQVRAVAGVGDLTARQLSSLTGAGNYVKSLFHGFRPQVPTVDATKAPGIVVFDPDFSVRWIHRGEALGDYPTLDAILERLATT